MKKFLAIVCALCFCMVACGTGDITSPDPDKSGGGGLHYDIPDPPDDTDSGGGGLHYKVPVEDLVIPPHPKAKVH